MTDLISLADHAASQSDRWMFIATLTLLIAFLVMIWRWIVADRAKLGDRLTIITDKYLESTQQLTEVVANNTTALNQV
jgi:hypothetical protein